MVVDGSDERRLKPGYQARERYVPDAEREVRSANHLQLLHLSLTPPQCPSRQKVAPQTGM